MLIKKPELMFAEAFYRFCGQLGPVAEEEAFLHNYANAAEEKNRILRLAVQGGEVVGYAEMQLLYPFTGAAPAGMVAALYVLPPYRKQKVGTALMVALYTAAKTRKVTRISAIGLKVDAASQAFFEQLGFLKRFYGYEKSIE